MDADHLGVKRFLRLDTAAYEDGALPGRTKELLGLVASAVLRCDDCINYHLEQCVNAGYGKDELVDALNVALIVGGRSLFLTSVGPCSPSNSFSPSGTPPDHLTIRRIPAFSQERARA